MVDYIAVPYADFNKYSKLKVQLVSDILLLYDITLAAKATIPDHSILQCSLSIYKQNSENDKDKDSTYRNIIISNNGKIKPLFADKQQQNFIVRQTIY